MPVPVTRPAVGAFRTKVLITGGGTAGHTNPGIAVAEALVKRGLDASEIHFVGGQRGSEGELVQLAGFSIDLLPGRGLRRSLTPEAVKQNLTSSIDLVRGVLEARSIVTRRNPEVVLCLGGYAAFAATLVAAIKRIPIVVSEQNARASAVNRLFGRLAKANALPYPDTDLPRGVLTGNPIGSEIVSAVGSLGAAEAKSKLGVDQHRTLVAVWSGSLGATRINEAVVALAHAWAGRQDVAIYHVVGRRDWKRFGATAHELAGAKLQYLSVEYEDAMPVLQSAADIAVCRSGASTTAELAVSGLPAILLPLPGAPRDHQTANAAELVAVGGAITVADVELSSERLGSELDRMVGDPERLASMAAAALSVARPAAANAVAKLLLADVGEAPR